MNKKSKNHKNMISSILKGEFIEEKTNISLIPFFLIIVILGLISIRSSFHAEKLLKKSISLEREVADLRFTNITTKSKLMSLYRRSTFEGIVRAQGLKTSLNAPEIIEK
jgi:hypothetical protein